MKTPPGAPPGDRRLEHEGRGIRSLVVREVAEACARLGLGGRSVLAAVSGGLDSSVLLEALCEAAGCAGIHVCAGHVNHGLRGAESDGDEAQVRAQAARLGIPFATRRVDPLRARRGLGSRARPTLQEAARELRYAALFEQAGELGANVIATAHHAEDQAETVLLRLLRGTGPDGLAGIPERSRGGRVVRPLLRLSRAELLGFAEARDLSWREDASNQQLDYARNRLRERWLPGLAADFNPRLLRAIADLAEAQRRDSEWIEERVRAIAAARFSIEGAWLRIEAKDWESTKPEALARRLAREALRRCGCARHVSRVHLERICEFLRGARGGSGIELPGGLRLVRDAVGFRLGPLPRSSGVAPEAAC